MNCLTIAASRFASMCGRLLLLLLCAAPPLALAAPAAAQDVDTITPGSRIALPDGRTLHVGREGIVTVATDRLEPPRAGVGWGLWGTAGKVTDEADAWQVARTLARLARGDREVDEIAARLQHLLRRPGSALYLEIDREGPFDMVLQPVRGSTFYLEIEPNGSRGAGEFRGGSLSVRTIRTGADEVHAFYIRGTHQPEYVAEIPPGITHVTLVVDGELIAAAEPVDAAGDALVYRVR